MHMESSGLLSLFLLMVRSLEMNMQISQGRSMAEGESTSGDHLVQLPAQSMFSYNTLLRASSGWVLSISKDGDSTASLSNLCSV